MALEESDPAHCEIEFALHNAEASYLQALERSIEDSGWRAQLAAHASKERESIREAPSFGAQSYDNRSSSAAADTAHLKRQRRRFAAFVEQAKLKSRQRGERTDHRKANAMPIPVDSRGATMLPNWGRAEAAHTASRAMEPDEVGKQAGPVSTCPTHNTPVQPSIEDELNEDATFSQFASSRRDIRRTSKATARQMYGREQRELTRELNIQEGDVKYLGFKAFDTRNGGLHSSCVIDEYT
jgi:hypothetical protein